MGMRNAGKSKFKFASKGLSIVSCILIFSLDMGEPSNKHLRVGYKGKKT